MRILAEPNIERGSRALKAKDPIEVVVDRSSCDIFSGVRSRRPLRERALMRGQLAGIGLEERSAPAIFLV